MMEHEREILEVLTPAATPPSLGPTRSMEFYFGKSEVEDTTSPVSSRPGQLENIKCQLDFSALADEEKCDPSPQKVSSGETQTDAGLELEVEEGREDSLALLLLSLVGKEKEDTIQKKGKYQKVDEVVVPCTQESQH